MEAKYMLFDGGPPGAATARSQPRAISILLRSVVSKNADIGS
jgi:hypothetical protein